MRNDNEKYCFNCGATIESRAVVCPQCGVSQPDAIRNRTLNQHWLATLLLCIFTGVWGIHRFYLGRVGTGILMLITLGGLGIWVIIDLILIVLGQIRDKNGQYVKPYLE
ncbi:MAG: TM2 domain-containing protein [Prolixibacteraceae bacterium]|jgi:TM2 domain-containing membrane protein YozV|nr:TM2 domain-containing protein [Prolixibacteraceae bacterium]